MAEGWRRCGRWAAPLGVFAAALWLCVGGLFAAPSAHAAQAVQAAQPARTTSGAQPAGAGCGGRLARTLPFDTGEVRVYKSRTRACAMAVARVPGERRPMAVSIQPRGGAPISDIGRFTRYAGPVTVGAINRCVYVKGSVGTGSAESGWILC
ncbi:hypothetical protein [Streptomyces sp. NPDC088762]|uniref:hypothetical protein n=1 Tax=Streptomyces sp. NPDC088762 TaxID=3365891 RepID=UPI00380407AC